MSTKQIEYAVLRVSFCNEGGELDHRIVGENDAAKAAIELIKAAGTLYDGDRIEVREEAGDAA